MKVELEKDAYMPIRAYPTDAGLDLYSREDITIKGYGGYAIFNTGGAYRASSKYLREDRKQERVKHRVRRCLMRRCDR